MANFKSISGRAYLVIMRKWKSSMLLSGLIALEKIFTPQDVDDSTQKYLEDHHQDK